MYILVLIISIALAIPSFGVSIALFFLFRNWWNNGAIEMMLKKATKSIGTGDDQQLYHVNNAAVRKLYRLYATQEFDVSPAGNGLTLYTGMIRHPAHQKKVMLSVFRKSITGELNINATENEPTWVEDLILNVKAEMNAKSVKSRENAEKSANAVKSDDSDDLPF